MEAAFIARSFFQLSKADLLVSDLNGSFQCLMNNMFSVSVDSFIDTKKDAGSKQIMLIE